MTKNHILGMDIAQNSALAQLDCAAGTRCWRGTVSTDEVGWQQLERALHEHGGRWADTLVIVEATGLCHLPWAERLVKAGAEVYVLNPLLAARLQSAANALRENKTDAVDVHKLCEIGRLYHPQLSRFSYRANPARQGLKQLDHARDHLRRSLTNLKKSLRSQLELVFPALLRAQLGLDATRTRLLLEKAPTAGAWRALPEVERRRLAGAKQAALDEACATTIADEALAQACVPAVRALLSALQALSAQLDDCDAQIAPRLPANRVALIASVPGFGQRTAAVMTTYLPESFEGWGPRKKIVARLQALFGTDPRLRRSGKWTGKVKISKRGIGAARTALFQAAFCSLARDPENRAYYESLRRGGKSHKQALVDVMRKQLRRLVAVLGANQPFVPKPRIAA